jgi:hypothetical protein
LDNEEIFIYLLTISITTWSKFFENWVTCIFVIIIIVVVIVGIATHTNLLRSKYDCCHFKNICTRKDEKSTTISLRLKVVTLMWHMVYMWKKERRMMGEKGRTRRKKANVYIQRCIHLATFSLFLLQLHIHLVNHRILFLNCLSTIRIFYKRNCSVQ